MPRYNVEYQGKWACFSGIVDDFITGFMDKPAYEKWRMEEYGNRAYPLQMCNSMTIDEATFALCANKSREYVTSRAKEVGIPDEVIEKAWRDSRLADEE